MRVDERLRAVHADVARERPDLHALVEGALEIDASPSGRGSRARRDRASRARRSTRPSTFACRRERGEGCHHLLAGIEAQDVATAGEGMVFHRRPAERDAPGTAGHPTGVDRRGQLRTDERACVRPPSDPRTSPMRIHVVANPTAGRGRARSLAQDVADGARRAGRARRRPSDDGRRATPAPTSRRSTATRRRPPRLGRRRRDAARDRQRAARAAARRRSRVVPLGTANLVARDAGIPLRADAATYARDRARRQPVDRRPARDRPRACRSRTWASGSTRRSCARSRARARGGVGGYARWLVPDRHDVPRLRAPRGSRCRWTAVPSSRGGAAIVQNTRNYGGLFTLASDARMDDGRLEVTVLRRAKRRDFFRMLCAPSPDGSTGTTGVDDPPGHVGRDPVRGRRSRRSPTATPSARRRSASASSPARSRCCGPRGRGDARGATRARRLRIATSVRINGSTVERTSMFGPSLGAWSGSSCTSVKSASTPTAAGGARERRHLAPVAARPVAEPAGPLHGVRRVEAHGHAERAHDRQRAEVDDQRPVAERHAALRQEDVRRAARRAASRRRSSCRRARGTAPSSR